MKNEVKIGRAEDRRRRSAQAQENYEKRKAESRKRRLTAREWDEIFKRYGVPGPDKLQEVIDQIIVDYRDGGVKDEDYAYRIFHPQLDDLTKLPVGLLDHKEVALPPELLPESKDEVRALCERMIIRNRNAELIDLVVIGWPGEGSPKDKLERHVSDLWQLRSVQPGLYRALICGQHKLVTQYLWRKVPPRPFTRPQLRRMLLCQGLLWCTNDLQLILARNALGERNPLGAFVVSGKLQLEPVRLVNDLKGHLLLLRILLDLYVTIAEQNEGRDIAGVPENPIAQLLKSRIEKFAKEQKMDLAAFRTTLDATVPHMKRLLRKPGKKFRRALEAPDNATDLPKHFSGIWFSGLTNLQASAVALLRYLQAETELDKLIDGLAPEKGKIIETRDPVALATFDTSRLRRPWHGRAMDMFRLYRRELLKDVKFRNTDSVTGNRKKDGAPAINVAKRFLEERGERLIGDDKDKDNCPRRTFYLLDIIPEARLHR
ncbi:MAG: hypothetical protein EOP62_20705 [Sphingomonadales bacterium]|nr:MAG: hypothetical protein EOP62_20705 [Sphingomonadales bacterium]